MNITVFKTISSTSTAFKVHVNVALERIRTGKDLEIINKIRLSESEEERKKLKEELPSFCFSGTFSQRTENGLKNHSGLCLLDFQGFKDEALFNKYREAFKSSKEKAKYTFAMFTSTSNKGIKVLVKIPPTNTDHKKYFKALYEFYNDEYLTRECEGVHQACFSTYDPLLYHNPDSEMWCEMEVNEFKDLSNSAPILKLKKPISIIQLIEKWFDKQKSDSLFLLASTLNDFGVQRHDAESYMKGSKYGNKKNEKEISTYIKSAFKKNGGTKYFEDTQSLELLERLIKTGGSDKKKLYKKLSDEGGHNEDEIENAIKNISDSLPVQDFWYFSDGKCVVKNYKFKLFLEQNGYYKYYPEGSKNFLFIRIENNMIENVTVDSIKSFTLKYLEQQSTIEPFEVCSGSSKMFKDDYLNIVSEANVTFFEDTQYSGVVYFKNGAVITRTIPTETKVNTELGEKINITYETKTELVDFLSLNGHVWKSYIINRDYEQVEWKDCVYDKFISLVAGNNKDKKLSIMSTIGYLMHSFKTSANNKAVILNDETISDNPNGGAGKGIFCAALGHMKRMVVLDGKLFNGDKSFAYQLVGPDTQLLIYDDLPRNFPFEKLFSVVTEGITLEKKNKDAIKLSVGKSPKIIMTTNYTIGGVGGSFERRKWELEFSSYFSANHTPLAEFKHMLFDEWSEEEWKKFDCFMIHCLSVYLEKGLVKQEFKNLAERKFIKETSFDFHEWVNETPLPIHEQLNKSEYFEKFVEEYPDYKAKWFTRKRFSSWLETYGKYKGYQVLKGKSLNILWINFTPMTLEAMPVKAQVIEGVIEPSDNPFA